MVDVRDRTGRRNRLQVLIKQTVLHYRLTQRLPVRLGRQRNTGISKQLRYPFGARTPCLLNVFIEVAAAGVLRISKTVKELLPFPRQLVRGAQRLVGDAIEVEIGEVQRFR